MWRQRKQDVSLKKLKTLIIPNFALDRGIRRRMPDIFFLKKFVHATSRAFTFCVETASAFFVSVLASNAKPGIIGVSSLML